MVNIKKIDNTHIEIDGVKVNIDKYNKVDENLIRIGNSKVSELVWEISRDVPRGHYGNFLGLDDNFFRDAEKAARLYGEVHGSLIERDAEGNPVLDSQGKGKYLKESTQLEEIRKNQAVNGSLYEKINRLENKGWLLSGIMPIPESYLISGNTEGIKKIVEKNNKLWDENLNRWKEIISLKLQLKKQKDNSGQKPGQDYVPPQKDQQEDETKLQTARQNSEQAINQVLNKSPTISDIELKSPNWKELLSFARTEKEIQGIEAEVLTDIQAKRASKKGEKPVQDNKDLAVLRRDAIREIHLEQNKDPVIKLEELAGETNSDWIEQINKAESENSINSIKDKVLADIRNRRNQETKAKSNVESLKKSDLNQLDKGQIAEVLKMVAIKEGSEGYEVDNKINEAGEKLLKSDIELYKKIHIDALKERLKENKIKEEEFAKANSDYKKFVNNEIKDINEFKRIKEELTQKSGEMAAKSKWESFIERVKTTLQKAKDKASEHFKGELKTIRKQFESLKKDKNAYLQSYQKDNQSQILFLEKSLEKGELVETTTTPPEKTPVWKVALPIGLGIAVVIAVIIVIRKRNKRVKSVSQKE